VPAITVLSPIRTTNEAAQNTLKEEETPIFFIIDNKTDQSDTL
jgi:hypothetical protein